MLSGFDTNIDAAGFEVDVLNIPTVLQRRGGLSNLFNGNVFWVAETPNSASISSFEGNLNLSASGASTFRGVTFFQTEGLNLPDAAVVVAAPDASSVVGYEQSGIVDFLRSNEER